MIPAELLQARHQKIRTSTGKIYAAIILLPHGRIKWCRGRHSFRTATQAEDYAKSIIKRLRSLQKESR